MAMSFKFHIEYDSISVALNIHSNHSSELEKKYETGSKVRGK